MKVQDIIELYDGLFSIYNSNKNFPIRVSLILSRNYKKIKEIIKDIDEKKYEILLKYGKRDENNNLIEEDGKYPISEEKLFNFREDIKELFDTKIDILLDTLTIEDIEKCEKELFDSFTIEEINAIQNIIVD